MKKILFICMSICLFSCEDESVTNNCFQGVSINEVVYLNNPEFTDLNVPTGSAITSLDGRSVIIIRNSIYKAFDLECPEADCSNFMTFDGLKFICPCSKKEYNSLNGAPINGKGCFALEYNVVQNGQTLQISR